MSAIAPGRTAGQVARVPSLLRGPASALGAVARRPGGIAGLAILAFFGIMALAPDLVIGPRESITTATGLPLTPPSWDHLLGTDEVGSDILNLVVHGARTTLLIGMLATFVSVVIGTTVGLVSGAVGGHVDAVLMRITELFLVIPPLVLALVLTPLVLEVTGSGGQIAGFRVSLLVLILVVGVTSWPMTARIIRAQTLSLRERAFVDRARVIGGSPRHIIRAHLLPNVMPLVVVNTILTIVGAIMTETTLSFIGLGDPLEPTWGTILSQAQRVGAATAGAWWYLAGPGIAILLVLVSFNLVGDALDDVLNPRLARRR